MTGYIFKKDRLLLVTLLFYFFIVLPSWWLVCEWYEDNLSKSQKNQTQIELQLIKNTLANALSRRSALFEGLCSFIQANPTEGNHDKEYNIFMKGLYNHSKGVRVMAVAPGGIQTYVYPIKGHESVVGHDILNDERAHVQKDIQRALKTREIIFNGPYTLRQGGLSLVMRKAIYFGDNFWGLAAMVIDIPPIIEEAGILIKSDTLNLSLKDNHGNVFFGQEKIFDSNPLILKIDILDGSWEVAGIPKGGWSKSYFKRLTFFRMTIFSIISLIFLLFYLFASRHKYLALSVDEKTFELSERLKDLKNSELKFKSVTETITDVFWMSTFGVGKMIYVSPAYEVIWEKLSIDLYKSPKSFIEKIHPDDRKAYLKIIEKYHKKGKPYDVEYRIIRKNYDIFWIYERGYPVVDELDGKKLMTGVCTDITERKLRENLANTQHELSIGLGNVNDLEQVLSLCLNAALGVSNMECGGIYLFDHKLESLDLVCHKGLSENFIHKISNFDRKSTNAKLVLSGDPVYANHQQIGVYLDDIEIDENLKAMAMIPVKYQDNILGCMNVACKNKDEVSYLSRIALETISNQIGNAIVHFNTQKILQNSEERFDLAMRFANDGLYDWNLETNEIFYSNGWKRMLGYEPEEIENNFSEWERLTKPEDVKKSWKMINEVIDGIRSRFELEFQMKHKNGSWVDILSRANVVFNKDGKAVRVVGTHVDITERKKYENDLKIKNAAIENSLNGFDIVNAEGKLIYVNKAYVKMWGYDNAKEIIGTSPVGHCVDPGMPEKVIKILKKNGSYEFEIEAKRKDGSTFDVLMYARLAFDEKGQEIYPTTCIDISEKKKALMEKERLENQLHHAQRLESIGTLAGGIAHDFNNILSPIIGFTEMSKDDLPDNHPVQENLDDVLQGAKRARDLVKQILFFSRQRDIDQEFLAFQPMINETLKLLRSTIPANIKIEKDLTAAPIYLFASTSEIHEIIMNLCTNAYHAMEEKGGTLTVGLNEIQPNPELELPTGKYCCLSIGDTGSGIPPDVLDNIFDPYFTTKEQGKGSGLGLSVIHGIVKSYNGAINIQSKTGKGTRVDVFLPITPEKNITTQAAQDVPIISGDESILFVDDEKTIVKLGVRLLEKLGYTVMGKTSSTKALELFKSNPYKFDLVITDMTMPGLLGTEFAKKILDIRPGLPILICTGFSERVDQETSRSFGIKGYINKPILFEELSLKVRELLDQGQAQDRQNKN